MSGSGAPEGRLLSPRIASMVCRGPGCCVAGGLTCSPLNNILVVTRSGAPASLLSASIVWRRLPSLPQYCPTARPSALFSQKRFRACSANSLCGAAEFPLPLPNCVLRILDGAEPPERGRNVIERSANHSQSPNPTSMLGINWQSKTVTASVNDVLWNSSTNLYCQEKFTWTRIYFYCCVTTLKSCNESFD
jgi:hypothetical protein